MICYRKVSRCTEDDIKRAAKENREKTGLAEKMKFSIQ
jgi:hypothetical protein